MSIPAPLSFAIVAQPGRPDAPRAPGGSAGFRHIAAAKAGTTLPREIPLPPEPHGAVNVTPPPVRAADPLAPTLPNAADPAPRA